MEIFRNFNERIAGNNGLSNHWPRKRGITFEISGAKRIRIRCVCRKREKNTQRRNLRIFPSSKITFRMGIFRKVIMVMIQFVKAWKREEGRGEGLYGCTRDNQGNDTIHYNIRDVFGVSNLAAVFRRKLKYTSFKLTRSLMNRKYISRLFLIYI